MFLFVSLITALVNFTLVNTYSGIRIPGDTEIRIVYRCSFITVCCHALPSYSVLLQCLPVLHGKRIWITNRNGHIIEETLYGRTADITPHAKPVSAGNPGGRMSSLALILVVISAAMHAVRNLLTKRALDKEAFVWWYELVGLFYFLPLLGVFIYREGLPPAEAAYLIAASGLIHFLYWLFMAKALETGDLSHVYPIMRSSPALVLLLSVAVLQEDVSPAGVTGIILVAGGVYSINLKEISLSKVLEPIRAIRRERATRYAFLTLLSVTAYSIVDKLGVMHMHPVVFAGLYPWLSMVFFTAFYLRGRNGKALRRAWTANKRSILVCGVLGIFGYFLILVALSFERVSYVVGARQISIVIAVVLGARILDEGNRIIRLTASIIIFAGTVLIAVAK